ncbi:MAG: hypothetical protein H6734_24165 [Alphaproteobacteria bacterium]|nr:hypothetical protein [Alphaproteobacteria bacterium]
MLGWAALSRNALNRAEAQLVADAQGVRDEVGVLALHFGYANRFFPGTSVQQTRLRYALFVPWQLLALMRTPGLRPGQATEALRQAEMDLARRLPDVEGEGTIGRNTVKHDKPVSIPPSQSYWVALNQWGILSRVGDVVPGRRDILSSLHGWREAGTGRGELTDDEHRSLDPRPRLFHKDLPAPPSDFTRGKALDFALTDAEREFLGKRIEDVSREDKQPAFLSVLVQKEAVPTDGQQPWSTELRKLADKSDRAALKRARDAAALSALARGFYLACVEHLKDTRDKRSSSTLHRDLLPVLIDRYRDRALRLDLDAVAADGVAIGRLGSVLGAVQAWLRRGAFDPGDEKLRAVLAKWERDRKGDRRARLPLNAHAEAARRDWKGDKAGKAVPIGYRWDLVRRLLRDLHGVG